MKTCQECGAPYPDALLRCPRHASGKAAPPEPESFEPLVGKTLANRYVIESVLGVGGMGTVYAARHALIDKRVAVKLLRPELVDNAQAKERFLIEARAASKVTHANVVDITDFGVAEDGVAFFAMEFLEGRSLGDVLREEKQLSPERAVAIAIQVARGLHAAHQKSIIHRDLKPDNLFLLPVNETRAQEQVKIVDFGIAKLTDVDSKLTQAGIVLGTPEYIAPEQALGSLSDARADLYALGCILYEMLTASVPFEGVDAAETLRKQVYEPPISISQRRPDLKLPAGLEREVLKAMAKRPEDRHADLAEFERALSRVGTSEDRVDSASSPRRRIVLVVSGAAVLAVLVSAALLLRGPRRVEPIKPERSWTVLDRSRLADGGAQHAVEIRILSTPSDVGVFLGDVELGRTPFTWKISSTAEPATVVLRKPGYRESEQTLARDRDQQVHAQLQKVDTGSEGSSSTGKPHSTSTNPRPGTHRNTSPHKPRSDLKNPF